MTRPQSLAAALSSAAVLVLALSWGACGPDGAPPADASNGAGAGASTPGSPALGEGFVVWESLRTGDWRIWYRRLDGSGLRQLSPDEPGRQHCCPHVSPDGTRLVYLSRDVPRDGYPKEEVTGSLRLVALDGSGEREIARGRTYGWGNRAAVWRDDRTLIHIDGEGRTVELDLRSGSARPLTPGPGPDGMGWLVNATLTHATTADPTFSLFQPGPGRVAQRGKLGGCEGYFSHDGRWGYWVPGAGGPIDRFDLGTREAATLVRKNDPRLAEQGYLYFPMASRDGRLFAFGASDDEHSHTEGNYDVYVAPSDPETLEIVGPIVRLTDHAASDRYPDVFSEGSGPWDFPGAAGLPAREDRPGAEAAGGAWPGSREELLFLWQTERHPNLVPDPALEADRAYPLEAHGRARLDRHFAMLVDAGDFAAPEEAAKRILERALATNELTVQATVTPARSEDAPARILTLSRAAGRRNFTLEQRGRLLVARVRTGPSGPNADRAEVPLFEVPLGEPTHVAFTFSPGRLRGFKNGEPAVESDAILGSFTMHWQPGRLLFGREIDGSHPWAGSLEGVAIYSRALAPEEIARDARAYRRLLGAREPVPTLEARGTLLSTSEIPTLQEISPYRQALVVHEYRLDEVLSGKAPAGGRVRVAHWALLDAERQPAAGWRRGHRQRLRLQAFAAHPQLESVYVSDTLGSEAPLYYGGALPGTP